MDKNIAINITVALLNPKLPLLNKLAEVESTPSLINFNCFMPNNLSILVG